jgi:hypothetical protein
MEEPISVGHREMGQKEYIRENERPLHALPSLFSCLVDQVSQLLDTKLTLLRPEIKEELQTYLRSTATILAGTVIAIVGFALLIRRTRTLQDVAE